MPQHKPQKQLTQKKEKTQKEEYYIYEGGEKENATQDDVSAETEQTIHLVVP
jgi:hypothetical protein